MFDRETTLVERLWVWWRPVINMKQIQSVFMKVCLWVQRQPFKAPHGDSSKNVEFLFCWDKIANIITRNVKQSLVRIMSRSEEWAWERTSVCRATCPSAFPFALLAMDWDQNTHVMVQNSQVLDIYELNLVPCSYPLIPCEENCAKQFSPALSSAAGTVQTWRSMLDPSQLLIDSIGPVTSYLESGLKLLSGWQWEWMCYIFPWKSEEGEACCSAGQGTFQDKTARL